jgi:hypothetical protein
MMNSFSLQKTNLGAAIAFPFYPSYQRDIHLNSIPEKTIRTDPEQV